jgi:hypothetical protein
LDAEKSPAPEIAEIPMPLGAPAASATDDPWASIPMPESADNIKLPTTKSPASPVSGSAANGWQNFSANDASEWNETNAAPAEKPLAAAPVKRTEWKISEDKTESPKEDAGSPKRVSPPAGLDNLTRRPSSRVILCDGDGKDATYIISRRAGDEMAAGSLYEADPENILVVSEVCPTNAKAKLHPRFACGNLAADTPLTKLSRLPRACRPFARRHFRVGHAEMRQEIRI